jgi:hypothetical protein
MLEFLKIFHSLTAMISCSRGTSEWATSMEWRSETVRCFWKLWKDEELNRGSSSARYSSSLSH